ncbi:MAG: hypothetical protein AAFY41_02320 [Bacteroidota bacterium]
MDDSTRQAYFSYVWQLDENTRTQFLANQKNQNPEDSLGDVAQPKTDYYAYAGEKVVPWRLQKRTKYGMIKKVPYPIKKYRLRTAPMENVLAPEPVSNNFVASEFSDSLRLDSLSVALDSTTIDSLATKTAVAEEETKFLYDYNPSDKFNVEQEYYNKYFAYKFIDNRPKAEPKTSLPDSLSTAPTDSAMVKEPFLKGLFKKKKRATDPQEDDTSSDDEALEETEETEEASESEEEGND